MPIGSSKLGVLGAGLVPGGSITFNAPGTWAVPPGVKKVSVTGKGGTGNPGNAGNQGNSGNPGTGAGGGSAGTAVTAANSCCQSTSAYGGYGGSALKRAAFPPCVPINPQMWVCNAPFNVENNNCLPKYTLGGRRFPNATPPSQLPSTPGNAGQGGQSGNAGTAGNSGNPGNPGSSSSALGNTFPGGAGGNAGAGGAAGNGGQGGQAGQGGVSGSSGGSGGNGGGSGSSGGTIPKQSYAPPCNTGQWALTSFGGGGAGVTNSGACAFTNSTIRPSAQPYNATNQAVFAKGGTGSLTRPNILPNNNLYVITAQGQWTSIQGGQGAGIYGVSQGIVDGRSAGMINSRNSICSCIALSNNQIYTLSQYNPGPQAPELIRAGGGGGAVGTWFNAQQIRNDAPGAFVVSGGGGGGGRGLAGNAGGPTPTPTGAAATPVTFNCVSVTPGTPTPITVASPGGQVNISWNPQ